MRTKVRMGIYAAFMAVSFLGMLFLELGNRKTLSVTVNRIDRIVGTSGNGGGFRTDMLYLVHTDIGTFSVTMEGFNAAAHLTGKLEEGRKYVVCVRGIGIPYFGIYPNIIWIEE